MAPADPPLPTSLFVVGDRAPLVDAADWVERTMLGTTASVVAVIAVASFGYLLLTGRVDLRRGATIIVGCFVLFGAVSIANGLRSLAGGESDATPLANPRAAVMTIVPVPVPTAAYDPYAGAAVPVR